MIVMDCWFRPKTCQERKNTGVAPWQQPFPASSAAGKEAGTRSLTKLPLPSHHLQRDVRERGLHNPQRQSKDRGSCWPQPRPPGAETVSKPLAARYCHPVAMGPSHVISSSLSSDETGAWSGCGGARTPTWGQGQTPGRGKSPARSPHRGPGSGGLPVTPHCFCSLTHHPSSCLLWRMRGQT